MSTALAPRADRRPMGVLVVAIVSAVAAVVTPFSALLALVAIGVGVWLLARGTSRQAMVWTAIGVATMALGLLAYATFVYAETVYAM